MTSRKRFTQASNPRAARVRDERLAQREHAQLTRLSVAADRRHATRRIVNLPGGIDELAPAEYRPPDPRLQPPPPLARVVVRLDKPRDQVLAGATDTNAVQRESAR